MRNIVKGLHKLFKAFVNEILQVLLIWGEYGSEVSYFIPEPTKLCRSDQIIRIYQKTLDKSNYEGD